MLSVCSVLAAETTYQRLLNAPAEPQNWLMRMGNYGNWNHSALTQINKSNVANLKVKFMASISDPNRPSKGNQYFTPLVEDGFMYVGNQYQQYWKFDVRDEKPKLIWKYDAKVQGSSQSQHAVALLGNKMYINTGRGRTTTLPISSPICTTSAAMRRPIRRRTRGTARPRRTRPKCRCAAICGAGRRGPCTAPAATRLKALWCS
jgi:hypothetical protein